MCRILAQRSGAKIGDLLLKSYICRVGHKRHKDMKTSKAVIAGACLAMAVACNQAPQQDVETNAVVETIMARRSIRNYKQVPVGRDTLNAIMECGINAPNGQNKQSWEVRVVDNPELLAEMSQAMGDAHPGMEFAKGCFRGAPVMVFIARDLSYDFSAYDCGLFAVSKLFTLSCFISWIKKFINKFNLILFSK